MQFLIFIEADGIQLPNPNGNTVATPEMGMKGASALT